MFCSHNDYNNKHFSVKNLGGKGFNLLKLYSTGKSVPKFLLLSTEAFVNFLNEKYEDTTLGEQIKLKLKKVQKNTNLEDIRIIAKELRYLIESHNIQNKKFLLKLKDNFDNLVKEINKTEDITFAVRSSATDEDLADFSFAGQHDTYLNIKPDFELVLQMIQNCWASIFSDRALIYRQKNLFESIHSIPLMCVVVQQMVKKVAYSGIMFTSDPLNSNRRIITIDSSYGLGEALVSGIVSADSYRVNKKTFEIVNKRISKKVKEIVALEDGTTVERDVDEKLQDKQTLSDKLISQLSRIGKSIEDIYKSEQDIEFAIDTSNHIHILQSRPITSLSEIPHKLSPFYEEKEKPDWEKEQGCFSFNHLQVMTDPMKPLGLSAIQNILGGIGNKIKSKEIPDYKSRFMQANGRAYINLSDLLTVAPNLIGSFVGGLVDNWIGKCIIEYSNRKEFKAKKCAYSIFTLLSIFFTIFMFVLRRVVLGFFTFSIDKMSFFTSYAVSKISFEENDRIEDKVRKSKDHFVNGFVNVVGNAFQFMPQIILGFKLSSYFHKDAQDLVLGIELNSTEMNNKITELSKVANKNQNLIGYFKTLDLTKKIDPNALIIYLQKHLKQDSKDFVQELVKFLLEFGCRGISEIDITNNRFSEDLSFIINIIINSKDYTNLEIKGQEFKDNREKTRQKLLNEVWKSDRFKWWNLLSFGIFGLIKYFFVARLFHIYQTAFKFREHPKHFMMMNLFELKKNLFSIFKDEKIFRDPEDIYYLTLDELMYVGEYSKDKKKMIDMNNTIEKRKENYIRYENINPPRFLTTYGENIEYTVQQEELKKLPPNTFIGQGVAPGISTGIVRVVVDPAKAIINEGEIIVAKNIDPAFSALFSHCVALVSEVGGLMTHGSVVAREMNIPAVVGVFNGTYILKTGQRIKVNGNIGTVQILEE
eukprot:gene7827-12301_t